MFNVSLRILNNAAEAEEVLQDSFLKAFEKIRSYDPKYAFGVWLKRMVINGSLDVLKKRKQLLVPLDGMQHAQEEEDDKQSEETAYDVEAVKKCVAQLPDGY